jgi:hypothetical protein
MNCEAMVYLELERIQIDTKVIGLLPRKLADRFHALPLAVDGERVTVAIANPENEATRNAISQVLGSAVYFVQADCQVIDKLLAEYWESVEDSNLELLLWLSKTQSENRNNDFSEYLVATLGAQRFPFEYPVIEKDLPAEVDSLCERFFIELLVVGKPGLGVQSGISNKQISPPSFNCQLVGNQPSWPIKDILLLLKEDAHDETALDWTINFAHPSGAKVTILPFTSTIPEEFCYERVMHCALDKVLSSQTHYGRKLRLAAQTLVNYEIPGMLRFRQEPPLWQIRFELLEKEYDLVIVDCGSSNWFWQSILAEAVTPLFSWTEVPMLIIKS